MSYVFSDTTLATVGLIQRCESLCSMGAGAISGDTTLLKQFTGYLNGAYDKMWMAQMSVDKNIKSDDPNYTDIPDAPITMVLSQADYTLPVAVTSANVSTFLRLKGVYFIANGVRTYLTPMTAEDTLTTVAGIPTKYQLNGKSIIFQCPLSASALSLYSSVFHVEFQRVPDAFLSTDTTQQAGILGTYHEYIAVEASSMYLKPIDLKLSTAYHNDFLSELENFKRDVANIDSSVPHRLTPSVESCE